MDRFVHNEDVDHTRDMDKLATAEKQEPFQVTNGITDRNPATRAIEHLEKRPEADGIILVVRGETSRGSLPYEQEREVKRLSQEASSGRLGPVEAANRMRDELFFSTRKTEAAIAARRLQKFFTDNPQLEREEANGHYITASYGYDGTGKPSNAITESIQDDPNVGLGDGPTYFYDKFIFGADPVLTKDRRVVLAKMLEEIKKRVRSGGL